MNEKYNHKNPLDALFSQPARSLEERIGLLARQVSNREALNQQIQSEIEFGIEQERCRLYRLRYSLDMSMPRHHHDTIKQLKQQQAIENVSAWKDVAFLERLVQEAKADHAREKTRAALLKSDKPTYHGRNR
jgi:hypothetical protein